MALSVQNFHLFVFIFFIYIHFDCDTNQVTLNCLEGSVYICAYLRPFRPTNCVIYYWVMCTYYIPRTYWVMCTYHVPIRLCTHITYHIDIYNIIIILSLANSESLLRYEVL